MKITKQSSNVKDRRGATKRNPFQAFAKKRGNTSDEKAAQDIGEAIDRVSSPKQNRVAKRTPFNSAMEKAARSDKIALAHKQRVSEEPALDWISPRKHPKPNKFDTKRQRDSNYIQK
jgi:hypothetical protein